MEGLEKLPPADEIIKRVVSETGKTEDEVRELISRLKGKYPVSSDSVLAFIVARSLGVDISIKPVGAKRRLKAKDILSMTKEDVESFGNSTFTISGYVAGYREAVAKSSGNRFLRFLLADDTGVVWGLVWGGKTGALVDEFLTKVSVWSFVEIRGAALRYREVDGNTEVAISLSGKFVEIVPTKPTFGIEDIPTTKIEELTINVPAKIAGTITAVDVMEYIGCANCMHKLDDAAEGEVVVCPYCGAKTRAIRLGWRNYYITDDTLTIRARARPKSNIGDEPREGDFVAAIGVLDDNNDFNLYAIKVLIPVSEAAKELATTDNAASSDVEKEPEEKVLRMHVTESKLGVEEAVEEKEVSFKTNEEPDGEAAKKLVDSMVNYVKLVGGKHGIPLDEVGDIVRSTVKRNPAYAGLDPKAIIDAFLKDDRVRSEEVKGKLVVYIVE